MTIILRTLCGCERFASLPGLHHYPPSYRLWLYRTPNFALAQTEPHHSAAVRPSSVREFEKTSMTGTYGYPVYLEKL